MTALMHELEAAIAELRPLGSDWSRSNFPGFIQERAKAIAAVLNAAATGQLVPAAPEPEGKTLAKLGVKPGDVVRCVSSGGLHPNSWTVGKDYTVEFSGRITDDDGYSWRNAPAQTFILVSRASEAPPVDPVREERLFHAALAALTGIMANPERWKDIASRYEAGTMTYDEASASNARKAVSVGRALLAALEAKP